jgi:hypothetical protein
MNPKTLSPKTLSRSLLAVAAVLVALACLPPSNAFAHRSGVPYHQVGMVVCGQGSVKAYPPRIMRSWQYLPDFRNPEIVHWSPDLYKYVGGKWRLADGSRPWYRAFTTSIGYYQAPFGGAWINPKTNQGQVIFVPYYYLSPGFYAIKNYMHWDYSNRTHSQFSGYCRVR